MIYTPEEIEKLPASRELDMAIGRDVFGLDSRLLHAQAGGKMVDLGDGGEYHVAPIDRYSRSVLAAWDVVAKLHGKGCHVSVATAGLAGFCVTVVEPDPDPTGGALGKWPRRWQAGDESAALAICRAALLYTSAA